MNFLQLLPLPFLALAPMDDVTDCVFRDIIVMAAPPDVFFTEFISSDGLFYKDKKVTDQKLKKGISTIPLIAQIWGSDPDKMKFAAQYISKLGFVGIDINMGCPDRAVVKKGAGAGLIGNYQLVEKIIKEVKEGIGHSGIPISVKTRLPKDKKNVEEWLSFLLKQNLAAITLHGRTAAQLSQGKADWEEIGKLVRLRDRIAPGTVIIGNGDIKNYQEAVEAYNKYRVDGIMIGRGILENPWSFEKVTKKQSKSDFLKLLIKHLQLFEKTWKNTKNYAVMKKYFKVYVRGFRGASELRVKLMSTTSSKNAIEIIGVGDRDRTGSLLLHREAL